jgi:hypothetical protein
MIGKIIRTRFFKTVTPGIDLKSPDTMRSWFFAILRDYPILPSDRDQYQHKYYSYGNYSLFHCVDNRVHHLWIVWQKNLSFSSLVLVTIAPPQDVVIILFPLKDNERWFQMCRIFPFIGTS